MDLTKALDDLKNDVRMRDWNAKHNLANKDDQEKYLKGLRDMAAECEEVTLEDKGDFEG